VYEERTVPELEYTCKHAFTQEATYQGILEKRRREFHLQVAREMERLYGDRLEECYEELAHHYSRSEDVEKAVEYLLKAGEKAVRASAYKEAIAGFRKGIEFVGALADKATRAQREAKLQTALGWALLANRGYASPEAEGAFSRARELCGQLAQTHGLFWALVGLDFVYFNRAEYNKARDVAERCLDLAQQDGDPALLTWAHWRVGFNLLCRGESAKALAYLEKALSLYDPQRQQPLMFMTQFELGAYTRVHMACALWLLGYPDSALASSRQAITRARELSHPSTLAAVLGSDGLLRHWNRHVEGTRRKSEAASRLAAEVGLPTWSAFPLILLGWCQVQGEQVEEGIALISQGLANYRAQGMEVLRSYYQALLAEAYGISGQADKGLELLADALAFAEKTGEGCSEAELHRIRGELLLMRGEAEDLAEESFRKAIDVARRQQAKSWELRAVTSLSRLMQKQGKQDEARRMLSEIYHWFTEGFDTADLKDAKALLDSLA